MKLHVFISSRNKDRFILSEDKSGSLEEVRMFLKEELERETLFEKPFLEISINETFGADLSKEKYQYCLDEVRSADFVIALYNGYAGWAPDGFEQGICHAEVAEALSVSSKRTALIDMTEFFVVNERDRQEKERNALFRAYLNESGIFSNPLKLAASHRTVEGFKRGVLDSVRTIIYKHLGERIKLSNRYFDLSSNTPHALTWKKMKYDERAAALRHALCKVINKSTNFSDLLTEVHAVPDNMSVADASAFTGRPFLKDVDAVRKHSGDVGNGPLHFIAVYGQATETQVKKLVGFPDVSTIRDGFGIYVWEQNTQIQLVFLVGCKTPEAVRTNFLLFCNWCSASREFQNIKLRARARFRILQAIQEANQLLESAGVS